jgi:hypothetical protein
VPDFARIFARFARILTATKYTNLSKVFQGDIMFLFQKYPKERSLCHDKDFNLRGVFWEKGILSP